MKNSENTEFFEKPEIRKCRQKKRAFDPELNTLFYFLI